MRELVNQLLALFLVLSAYGYPRSSQVYNPQAEIPEATEPSSAEEAKWWRRVCEAVRDLADATARKDKAISEARSQASKRRGRVLDDDDDGLSANDRDTLTADIRIARKNYSLLLQERVNKSYRVPISDARPTVLYTSYPVYPERAARSKTTGTVRLRVEFRADGMFGRIMVIGLPDDALATQAIQAAYRMVFLPATRDRVFVTYFSLVDVDFSLR